MGSPSPELSNLWLARAFNAQDVEAAAALYHTSSLKRRAFRRWSATAVSFRPRDAGPA